MKTKALLGSVAAGGAVVARRLLSSDGDARHNGRKGDRWHFVTINRAPEEVRPDGRLPQPLAEIADRGDVQVRPAPGNRGTELGARVRGAPSPPGRASWRRGSRARIRARRCERRCASASGCWRPARCCSPTRTRAPAGR
jgi:hypothetical protein